MSLTVNFDGACWPNPGGRATWGYVIRDDDGNLVSEDSGRVVHGNAFKEDTAVFTNNVAEWAALHAALAWLSENGYENREIAIKGDSQLVVKQLTGEWQCKKAYLRVYLAECRKLLERFRWSIQWVSRDENSEADRLSTEEWEEEEGKPFPIFK